MIDNLACRNIVVYIIISSYRQEWVSPTLPANLTSLGGIFCRKWRSLSHSVQLANSFSIDQERSSKWMLFSATVRLFLLLQQTVTFDCFHKIWNCENLFSYLLRSFSICMPTLYEDILSLRILRVSLAICDDLFFLWKHLEKMRSAHFMVIANQKFDVHRQKCSKYFVCARDFTFS